MGYTRLLGTGIKKTFTFFLDRFILFFPIYYTKLDEISIKRYFSVMEGSLKNLYKFDFINYIPTKFLEIMMDMLFQMDYLNTEIIEKESQIAILRSIAARTKSKEIVFQADCLAMELEKKKQTYKNDKGTNLNSFINYIERTFNREGTIDPEKISASRAFSLFHAAVEENKRLEQLYKKK